MVTLWRSWAGRRSTTVYTMETGKAVWWVWKSGSDHVCLIAPNGAIVRLSCRQQYHNDEWCWDAAVQKAAALNRIYGLA